MIRAARVECARAGSPETCRAGGGVARYRLEQCVIEIGLAVYVGVLHADPVEPGGLERFAAAQRREELVGFDSPQPLLAPARRHARLVAHDTPRAIPAARPVAGAPTMTPDLWCGHAHTDRLLPGLL